VESWRQTTRLAPFTSTARAKDVEKGVRDQSKPAQPVKSATPASQFNVDGNVTSQVTRTDFQDRIPGTTPALTGLYGTAETAGGRS
jgi:hypothetical protein